MKQRANFNPFILTGSQKLRNYSVATKSKRRWFEVDLFSDKQNQEGNDSLSLLISQKIINWWLIIILVGILALVGRTAYLQLVKGDDFRAIAEGNRIRIRDIKAARGVIYDRSRNLLVENVPSFSLAIIPVDLPKDKAELQQLAEGIAPIAQKSASEINQILTSQPLYSYQPVEIAENLNHDQAILTQILSSHFTGVILKTNSTRHYLTTIDQPSLSHILGYPGKIEEEKLQDYLAEGYSIDDYIGKAGLEFFYETELKGVNGREQVEVDATGQAKEVLAQQKSISGQNLVLTIDSDLQKQAQDSLSRALGASSKKKGAVIVLDPNSGQVLALVSLPAFDNNLFSQGISSVDFSKLLDDLSQPLFSRAVSGEYPSGSTFKLVVSAAALQEGIINESTRFLSTGGIAVDRWFFPDWKAGGHGWTNVTKALAESVNTFFYIIGGGYEDFVGLGVDKMKEYAEKFGLNNKLGIDLPNEASGFFPSVAWKNQTKGEKWFIGDTYHVAIGQGDIIVTPLQVAAWTSVIANGGTLYKPHLIKELLDSDNQVTSEIKPQVLNENFISQENIDIVKRGLRLAVTTGSAKGLFSLPLPVAAKTGTAQWSSTKPPHAWLTAFAPYSKPQIVVTILVEEAGEGSSVALPVAYDIINWWATNRYSSN
ncbi:MAG: penicillin-binding protein 2 [Patescibacteria group bacterium]|jgi:penicillin-binding protein 2